MIFLYTLDGCPFCEKALKLLKENNIKYKNVTIENNENIKKNYKKITGMQTFPMIFSHIQNDVYIKIGGASDLEEAIERSKDIKKSSISIDSIYNVYKNMFSKK